MKKYSQSSNIHKHLDAPLECSHDHLLPPPPPLPLPPPQPHRRRGQRRRLPLSSRRRRRHHRPLPENHSCSPPPCRLGREHERVPPGPAPGGGGRRVLPGGLRDGVHDGRGVPAAPGPVQGHGRAGGGGLLPDVVRQLQVHREALNSPLQGLRRKLRLPRRLPQAQRDRRVRREVGGGGQAAHQGRAIVPLLQGRGDGGVVRHEGQGEDHRCHREVHIGSA